jgi:hypothetical protein
MGIYVDRQLHGVDRDRSEERERIESGSSIPEGVAFAVFNVSN